MYLNISAKYMLSVKEFFCREQQIIAIFSRTFTGYDYERLRPLSVNTIKKITIKKI